VSSLALGTIERLLNALLDESSAARECAAALEGKRLGTRLVGLEVEIVVYVAGGRLRLEREPVQTADAVLSGTPIALLKAWRLGKEGLLADRGVSITGDAEVLQDFVQLFDLAKPDLEEELSRVTGDVIAHEAFRAAGSLGAWASRALDALAMNTAEFLQEERRDLPAPHEAEGFYRDIETLRDDVERALARADRLTARRDVPGGTEEG
jgi:ubiquinone biosynthesis accessory factor UbiJ